MSCPERGDLIKCDFDNTVGHEQANFRRALVLSPIAYNAGAKLAIVCAITNVIKGYPFEVNIPAGLKVTGTILADQVRTIDWEARGVTVVDKLPPDVLAQVQSKLSKLTL
jgi:mRNA interferase MazF